MLLRGVPGHALDVVPVLGQAPLALALEDVPHHAHVLDGPRQQRCAVRRPGRVIDVLRVPAPAGA